MTIAQGKHREFSLNQSVATLTVEGRLGVCVGGEGGRYQVLWMGA